MRTECETQSRLVGFCLTFFSINVFPTSLTLKRLALAIRVKEGFGVGIALSYKNSTKLTI